MEKRKVAVSDVVAPQDQDGCVRDAGDTNRSACVLTRPVKAYALTSYLTCAMPAFIAEAGI